MSPSFASKCCVSSGKALLSGPQIPICIRKKWRGSSLEPSQVFFIHGSGNQEA